MNGKEGDDCAELKKRGGEKEGGGEGIQRQHSKQIFSLEK